MEGETTIQKAGEVAKDVAKAAIGNDVSAWVRTATQLGAFGVLAHLMMQWSENVWAMRQEEIACRTTDAAEWRKELTVVQVREDARATRAWENVKMLREEIRSLREELLRQRRIGAPAEVPQEEECLDCRGTGIFSDIAINWDGTGRMKRTLCGVCKGKGF